VTADRLATRYLGFHLRTPLVASASPLSRDLDGVRRLEDAGAGAIVLHSLFAEQIAHDSEAFHAHLEHHRFLSPEADAYLPEPPEQAFGADEYLELVRRTRESVRVPVIASLNAARPGSWVDYARQIESAGARALELNIYSLATDLDFDGADVEAGYLEAVAAVREAVTIPLAVKMHPYFSSVAAMARRLDELGVDALVLFNRFYQPDIDLDKLEVVPALELSSPYEGRLAVRWLAILFGRLRADLAATTGVQSATEVTKMLAAGAQVTMLASALLRHGPQHLRAVEAQLATWLDEHEYGSLEQLRGSMSQRRCPDPAAFERANYMRTLLTWSSRTP
jgi:dihydroorotate dehydrogenase (fumarate)